MHSTLHRTPTQAFIARPTGRTRRVRRLPWGRVLAMVGIVAMCGAGFAWVVSAVANGRVW